MTKFFAGLALGIALTATIVWLRTPTPKVVEAQPVICPNVEVVAESSCEEIDKESIEEAFLLLLASLGVKKDYSQDVAQIVAAPESYEPKEIVATPEPTATIVVVSEPEIFLNIEQVRAQFAKSEVWQELRHSEPAANKASRFIVSDPALFIARSKLVEKGRLFRRINGHYIGKLYRIDGENAGKLEDVDMRIQFTRIDKKIDGQFTMTLSRDGVEYSRSRGEGGNNDVYTHPTQSEAIIIKASPTMFFHFENSRLELANVYSNNQYVGFAKLSRL